MLPLEQAQNNQRVAKKLMDPEHTCEFGEGFLQQLFYFSEHLHAQQFGDIQLFWSSLSDEESKEKMYANNPMLRAYYGIFGEEGTLQHLITITMSGAVDHLRQIVIPKRLPEEIKDMIRDLCKTSFSISTPDMRGSPEEMYTKFVYIKNLVNAIMRALDYHVFDIICDPGDYQ